MNDSCAVIQVEDPLTAKRYVELLADAGLNAELLVKGSAPEVGVPSAGGRYWELRVGREHLAKATELIALDRSAERTVEREQAVENETGGQQPLASVDAAASPGFKAAGTLLVAGAVVTVAGVLVRRLRGEADLPFAAFALSAGMDWLVGTALLRGAKRARMLAVARLIGGLLAALGGSTWYFVEVSVAAIALGALLIGAPSPRRVTIGSALYLLVLFGVVLGALWPHEPPATSSERPPIPSAPAALPAAVPERVEIIPSVGAVEAPEPKRAGGTTVLSAAALAGDYWRTTEPPGHARKVSFCGDGNYYEYSRRTGTWSLPNEATEGTIVIALEGGGERRFAYRTIKQSPTCPQGDCEVEFDGFVYARDVATGNCASAERPVRE